VEKSNTGKHRQFRAGLVAQIAKPKDWIKIPVIFANICQMPFHKGARRRDHEKLGVDLQVPERPVKGEWNNKHVTDPICSVAHGLGARASQRREYTWIEGYLCLSIHPGVRNRD
jgi:hypothetical protein